MGHKISDGLAIDVTAPTDGPPNTIALEFGELYRIGGWNGIAMKDVLATDTDRGLALEVSMALWKIKIPNALAPANGEFLYWDDPSSFQSGPDDIVLAATAVAGEAPCAICVGTKNAANYITVRVLNQADRGVLT